MDEEYYETLCKINLTCFWYSCCFVWPQACCWLQRNSNTARRTSQIFWPSGSWRTQVSKAMWWEGDLNLLTNFFWFCISFSLWFKHYMCVWEFSTLGTWFLCVDLFFLFQREKQYQHHTLRSQIQLSMILPWSGVAYRNGQIFAGGYYLRCLSSYTLFIVFCYFMF